MNKLSIKEANPSDAPYISLLGRTTFTETFGNYFRDKNDLLEYNERTFSVKKISASLKKPDNNYWIAFIGELPVGYAKLKLNSSSEFIKTKNSCQLQKIYVLKDFISQKIGHRLQETLLQKATAYNYKSVWLAVLNENERAIGFYKKNGFVKVGDHTFGIGKETFEFAIMEKSL